MVIRNNITPDLVKRHLKKVDEEEKERLAKVAEQYGGCCYGSSYTTLSIQFYEWSDLNSQPKLFTTYFSFFKFCVECNIEVSNSIRQRMYDMRGNIFVTCKQGKPELLVASTYSLLKTSFETCVN